MTLGLRFIGLLLLLALFVTPAPISGQTKDKDKKTDTKKKDAKKDDSDKDKDKDKKKEEEQLVQVGRIDCKLLRLDNGKLGVQTKQRVPGKNEFRDVNMDFELADKVMVRVQQPPVAFDDKGQVKKYTKEELNEMKGEKKNEFGYHAEIDILKPGQVLRIFLGKPKGAPRKDPPQIFKIYVDGNGEVRQ